MSPRRKPGNPMKYRGFYCDDPLYREMQHCAEIADESDSEYIRKAVAERNAQYNAQAKGEVQEKYQQHVAKSNSQSETTEVQTFFKK